LALSCEDEGIERVLQLFVEIGRHSSSLFYRANLNVRNISCTSSHYRMGRGRCGQS
jgi:hypothetical protein